MVFNTLSSVSASPQSDFSSAGVRTLQLSAAFPRIRNNTKVYNTHLVGTPSAQQSDSYGLSSLYTGPNSAMGSTDYGIKRPSTLISASSLIGSPESSLDRRSFSKFLRSSVNSSINSTESSRSQPLLTTSTVDSVDDAVRLSRKGTVSGGANLHPLTNSPSTRSNIEFGSNPDLFTGLTEFLDSSTLSDSTDKILPTDQTVAQQTFNNPQRLSDFYGTRSLTTSSVPSSSVEASLNASIDFG